MQHSTHTPVKPGVGILTYEKINDKEGINMRDNWQLTGEELNYQGGCSANQFGMMITKVHNKSDEYLSLT